MPGLCADCGHLCTQRADDGKFYCDTCWQAWTTSSAQEQAQWEAKRREQQEAKAREQQAAKEAKQRLEREAKERAYWEARAAAEAALREGGLGVGEASALLGETKQSAVFWGICDLKYDPGLPIRDRVKVLELGDGRASRFSHHGAVIKEKFEIGYCMDAMPLKRQVMVDNKKFTHDTFVQCGFGHLRPKQFAYLRRYEPDLAARIAADLDIAQGGAVVLKLVNRARGAGVVVCPGPEHLDGILQRLLMPPLTSEMPTWLQEHAARALTEDWSGDVLAEQQLHYWTNESPLFVVEELCHSLPIPMPDAKARSRGADQEQEEGFDATMRVAFALRRHSLEDGKLELDWLGGYWKLPPAPMGAPTGGGDIAEAHARLVSSFNTEEKRTAPVAREHLLEVYAALSPALPAIFELGNVGVRELTFSYPDNPLFRAFLLTRCGAVHRITGDLQKSSWVVEQARRLVRAPAIADARSLPERSVLSYIERTLGVNAALRQDWTKALAHFQEALARMPTNASAHYLKAVALHELGRVTEAVEGHLNAVALDPDFRSPLMALGECWTQMGLYQKAIEASLLCLHRQPDAPVAQFNIAQATYRQLRCGAFQGPEAEAAELRARARAALEVARAGMPERWSEAESEMRRYLEEEQASERDRLPMQALRSWRMYGWRP